LRRRIGKEDTLFSPSNSLGQEGKGLATEGMKWMGDGEVMLTIRVIRCSSQFVHRGKPRGRSTVSNF
jgi:hypothetical protein